MASRGPGPELGSLGGFHVTISKRTQKTVIGVYAASFAIYTLILAVVGRGGLTALVLAAMTVGPAILFFCGVLWARSLLGSLSLLLFLFWGLMPFAQHAIDRTGKFWLFWIYFGVVLVAGSVASFLRPSETKNEG